jgi:hypothetical protein
MGGILGALSSTGSIGGSSAKTDRGNFLGGLKDISNVYNWALPFGQSQGRTGQATTATGVSDLGSAGDYFKKLASGDRSTALSAVAPASNAAIAQNDASKTQLSNMGTARGGGAAGVNQQRDTDLMSKIDNMLFGARTAGATGEAEVGQAESGVGLGETGQAIQAGGLANRAGESIADESRMSRPTSYGIHQATSNTIAGGLEDTMTGIFKALGIG